jgi:hypothetical protein
LASSSTTRIFSFAIKVSSRLVYPMAAALAAGRASKRLSIFYYTGEL